MNDLSDFRTATRVWLEANCPHSMRQPVKDPFDVYWGGRNAIFTTQDQKIWFEKMLEKRWIVPYWEEKYGGGGLTPEENNILTKKNKVEIFNSDVDKILEDTERLEAKIKNIIEKIKV